MGLLSLLLQDRSEFVLADAAEERADIMRLLDHPLQTAKKQLSSEKQLLITLAMLPREHFVWTPNLSNLYRVLCGSSGVVLYFELLHQLVKSKNMKTSTDSHESHVQRRIVLM